MKNAEGGHDWFHTNRVYRNSIHIAEGENVNILVISLGALLHDIADSKFYNGDESVGPNVASKFMTQITIPEIIQKQVLHIIENISFKGGNFTTNQKSKELEIVQDADRLDAIGAVGIARCFNYGGFKNRKLYDPEIPPNLNMSKEEYKKSTAPTINHFYEKLLKIKGLMNTQIGKKMAEERHEFMLVFLDQFYDEWEAK